VVPTCLKSSYLQGLIATNPRGDSQRDMVGGVPSFSFSPTMNLYGRMSDIAFCITLIDFFYNVNLLGGGEGNFS